MYVIWEERGQAASGLVRIRIVIVGPYYETEKGGGRGFRSLRWILACGMRSNLVEGGLLYLFSYCLAYRIDI